MMFVDSLMQHFAGASSLALKKLIHAWYNIFFDYCLRMTFGLFFFIFLSPFSLRYFLTNDLAFHLPYWTFHALTHRTGKDSYSEIFRLLRSHRMDVSAFFSSALLKPALSKISFL